MKTKSLFLTLVLLALGGSLFGQTLTPAASSTGSITTNAANCNTTNACIILHLASSNVGYSVTASGTWTGTLTVEQSGDNQGSWTSATTTTANTLFTSPLTPGITDVRVRGSAAMTGTAVITITASGPAILQQVSSSSSSGAAPSSAYTFSVSGSTITASPNASGLPTYSGTDMAVVFNNVTTQLATVGGRLFFKNGVYTANSATLESTTGCSTFDGSAAALAYVFNFPSNTVVGSVQWILEGEASPVWQGEAGSTTVNNNGVIFNVSSTAVSSVAAGTIIAGFWQRPSTNCTLTTISPANASNDVHFKNMSLRFPTNQRGNEIGFAAYFNQNVEYENVVADFNLAYNSIATGSAPVAGTYGSFGMTSTVSSAGAWQSFINTFVTGWNLGYDWQSEHIRSWHSTAIYTNFPFEIGRSGTLVFHPMKIINFHDQENKNGGILGPQMAIGSRTDFDDLDIEVKNDGNWYARSTGLYTESNCNFGTGRWSYQVVGSGISTMAPLFTTCGANIQINYGAAPDNFAYAIPNDTFTHPSNSPSWGAFWAQTGSGNVGSNGCLNTAITGNTAVTSSTSVCYYNGQAFNAHQFSRMTVNTISATTAAEVTVLNNLTATNKSSYQYRCSTSGGLITNRSITITNSAGVPTVLLQTAAASGCGAGDIIELDVIPTGSTNRLVAYYTASGGARIKDLEVTDATLSAGAPGILLSGGAGVSVINWTGGNLPTKTGLDSIYLDDAYTSLPRKAFVDTADYTNATTTFSNLIGVGSNNGLSFIVEKNVRYTMHCAITWNASAVTAGPQFQITGPASPTSVSINMMSAITATTTASAAATAFSSALNPVGATVTSAVNETAYIDMGLVNGANAGTIQLQAAAQGAGTLTIRQGSSCTLQ